MSAADTAGLTAPQQELYRKAKQATACHHYEYAITLLRELVNSVPAYVEARRLLRANELSRFRSYSAFVRKMAVLRAAILACQGTLCGKKSPPETLHLAEDILAIHPSSMAGNRLLAKTAAALQLPQVALLACETIREFYPNDTANLKTLGLIYLQEKLPDQAQQVFQDALAQNPQDGDLHKLLKDASARLASQQGSWEQDDDFRTSLKNPAIPAAADPTGCNNPIERLCRQLNPQQPNPELVLQIARLYEQDQDFSTALQWFEYAQTLHHPGDPHLAQHIDQLKITLFEQAVAAHQEKIVSAQMTERSQLEHELSQLQHQQTAFKLTAAQTRVARYPHETMFRYELGQALIEAGLFREAVPQLQMAAKQPALRQQAANLLGIAFWKRQMHDFAIKQFQHAAHEIVDMNDLKKEILYNLGCVLLEADKPVESLSHFKAIYEVDAQYRDVAERVETSYP